MATFKSVDEHPLVYKVALHVYARCLKTKGGKADVGARKKYVDMEAHLLGGYGIIIARQTLKNMRVSVCWWLGDRRACRAFFLLCCESFSDVL